VNARRVRAAALDAVPRPLCGAARDRVTAALEAALAAREVATAALCVHELWMRGEMGLNIERALQRLWAIDGAAVPHWLPMRHIEWLPTAYEVASHCRALSHGRSNLYLVLLDYSDSAGDPYGIYVGMTGHAPADRFDQHKAGIRASGSVLRRGIELLVGPVMHLQGIARADALRIEAELAEALRAAGLRVRGGH